MNFSYQAIRISVNHLFEECTCLSFSHSRFSNHICSSWSWWKKLSLGDENMSSADFSVHNTTRLGEKLHACTLLLLVRKTHVNKNGLRGVMWNGTVKKSSCLRKISLRPFQETLAFVTRGTLNISKKHYKKLCLPTQLKHEIGRNL